MTTPSPRFPGVCIDYGHGGRDPVTGEYLTPGSKQYTFPDGLFVGEGITNRMTAALLIGHLLGAGIRVWDCVAQKEWHRAPHWTELEQRNIGLGNRTSYANRTCSMALLLSIHSNAIGMTIAGPSQSARGTVFFTSPGRTTSDGVAGTLYEAFERAFEDEPVHTLRGDWNDGDVDHEANFHVLRETRGSAVLGEVLFFTNRQDAEYLLSEHGQHVIAEAYFDGIAPWLISTREPVPGAAPGEPDTALPTACLASPAAPPAERARAAYHRALFTGRAEAWPEGLVPAWSELDAEGREPWEAVAAELAGTRE